MHGRDMQELIYKNQEKNEINVMEVNAKLLSVDWLIDLIIQLTVVSKIT